MSCYLRVTFSAVEHLLQHHDPMPKTNLLERLLESQEYTLLLQWEVEVEVAAVFEGERCDIIPVEDQTAGLFAYHHHIGLVSSVMVVQPLEVYHEWGRSSL